MILCYFDEIKVMIMKMARDKKEIYHLEREFRFKHNMDHT